MSEYLEFNDIKIKVENKYPLAISSVFNRYRNRSSDDMGAKHKLIIETFEALIKFLSTILLQEANTRFSNFKEKLPQKEKTLEFLKRPSLGKFVGLVRILTNIDLDLSQTLWMKPISEWYNQPKNNKNRAYFDLLRELKGINYNNRSKKPIAEICNVCVTVRNKQLGHGSTLPKEEIKQQVKILEHLLAFLFDSASFLETIFMFYIEKIELKENDKWKHSVNRLNGLHPEKFNFTSPIKLELHEIYLCNSFDEEEDYFIKISPFMIWHYNEDLKKTEMYFYNDAMRTKLEYISYMSGSFYYHKELSSDFTELFKINLRKGLEEDVYKHLSTEERAEKAEYYFKKGLLLKNEKKYEDALEFLEHSIEFERKAQTFIEIAKIQDVLGDSQDTILVTLQHALEVDPDNIKARDIYEEYDVLTNKTKLKEKDVENTNNNKNFLTIIDAFAPRKFRDYSGIFFSGIIFIWFTFSIICEIILDNGFDNIISIVGIMIGSLVFAIGLPLAIKVVKDLKLPLSIQLDKMRLERFNKWFKDQLKFIFGEFIFENEKLDFQKTIKKEKLYYFVGLLWTIVLETLLILVSQAYTVSFLYLIKKIIDFGFIIILLYPCVRYVFGTTIFIINYSKLSIKPMLTDINDDGLRAFSSLLKFNILLATIANIAFFTGASFYHSGSIFFDFPILLMITSVVFTWSIGMPKSIQRAAKSAKNHSIHTYAEHIENAFSNFIEEPNEENLDNYQWLLKNQKIIKNISTWPLNWKETLFVVFGSNFVLILVNVWFIIKRLNLFDLLY